MTATRKPRRAGHSDKYKHNTIHVEDVADLIVAVRRRAKQLGWPDGLSVAKLTKTALASWAESSQPEESK